MEEEYLNDPMLYSYADTRSIRLLFPAKIKLRIAMIFI